MKQAPAIFTTNVCSSTRKLKTGYTSSCSKIILLLLLTLTTLPVTARPAAPPPPVPSRQALELIEKARQAGRKGNHLIANKLWNKAGTYDPAVPASPPHWDAENSPQPFTASLSDRAITREELLVLITMLPYQKAQKQLKAFLDRFPLDNELRELSLAMAELHNDARLEKLHESALSGQVADDFTWLYGMRLLMLIGYVFLIRFILNMRSGRLTAAVNETEAQDINAGEQS